ncbi:histone lysine N methyltransferase, H3 lysine 79 [Trichuris trichiura]|uniref:Histone-lysine N-methyltransferase, H3 lysine-79 specific n=1 Tax=Trichuris trichiura TaxID=36087 RepID=A0A077ZBK8_TRITR|nr:histone lysine N methyltransferase, H3 lysine 79 [Trichuris trichiura]
MNVVEFQSFQNTKKLLVEHILQVVYNNSVVKPAKLNLYPPSSSSAYGETSFQMVEEMIRYLNITSDDSFLDLGSGVGQVVLHVAAATECRVAVGIECREWPIFFARVISSRWMNWFGIPYQSYELLEGDFMDEKFRHYINEATQVYCFHEYSLEEIFLTLNDGVRIVSSRKFAEPDQRLNARNMNGSCQFECLRPAPVSWTSKPLPYFIHTIDRQKVAAATVLSSISFNFLF